MLQRQPRPDQKRKWWRSLTRKGLKEELKQEILKDLQHLLPLQKVSEDGQPDCSQLGRLLSNIDATNLNIKFFGFELARSLAAALPVRTDTEPSFVGLTSKCSTQVDIESDWVAHWCGQLLTPVLYHRKLWELSYVLQAIYEAGLLRPGARSLGFGCGQEPIPSYLASHGVEVTVTDLEADRAQAAGWSATGQHAASLAQAYQPLMIDRTEFDRLVSLRYVDMNAIPSDLAGYDFCWSVCALEHLGSIDRGLAFIENSLATLKPGGLSVHTTELNIDPEGRTIDNWATVLFKREHFEGLAARLRAQGHTVAPLDFDLGDKPMDRFIDLPPWGHDLPSEFSKWHGEGAHLKVALDGFVSTCFGISVRKAG